MPEDERDLESTFRRKFEDGQSRQGSPFSFEEVPEFRRGGDSAASEREKRKAEIKEQVDTALKVFDEYLKLAGGKFKEQDVRRVLGILGYVPIRATDITIPELPTPDRKPSAVVVPVGAFLVDGVETPLTTRSDTRRRMAARAERFKVEPPEKLINAELRELTGSGSLRFGQVISLDTREAYGNDLFPPVLAFVRTIDSAFAGGKTDFSSVAFLVDNTISQLEEDCDDISFPILGQEVNNPISFAEFILAFSLGLSVTADRQQATRDANSATYIEICVPSEGINGKTRDDICEVKDALEIALRAKFENGDYSSLG